MFCLVQCVAMNRRSKEREVVGLVILSMEDREKEVSFPNMEVNMYKYLIGIFFSTFHPTLLLNGKKNYDSTN